MPSDQPVRVALSGVSSTALWTLRNRAAASMSANSPFHDYWAEKLYRSIDFPFEEFGAVSESHAVRAQVFDAALLKLLRQDRKTTVVALGEGLQTTFWRLGSPDVQWLSVDLPEVIEIRRQLLPADGHITDAAMSALDRSWFDYVEGTNVIITAEGLLMYLAPDEVTGLLADLATRFPGGNLIFDTVPPWFVELSAKGVPIARNASHPMPAYTFGCGPQDAFAMVGRVPGLARLEELTPEGPQRLSASKIMVDVLRHVPFLRNNGYFTGRFTFTD
ncbi:class I SAM-dependent methyltransferase [Nocardia arthritidis]|uniref:Class I SAM-dependent methyltransferase n=1 Tax=Nocardia arthritidis TaxID=228602 RepID=A0A6G9YRR4_9NOCA|nr:class I SAM-dependent methyltransferase [Nocardia arthritidis]QIS15583.1 class I SAM-dependent methyltransferase [Nocardia arthritidis]